MRSRRTQVSDETHKYMKTSPINSNGNNNNNDYNDDDDNNNNQITIINNNNNHSTLGRTNRCSWRQHQSAS